MNLMYSKKTPSDWAVFFYYWRKSGNFLDIVCCNGGFCRVCVLRKAKNRGFDQKNP